MRSWVVAMAEKYPFLKSLSGEDLARLYLEVRRALASKGLLKQVNKAISKSKAVSYVQTAATPAEFSRGKIKRNASESILIDFLREDWSGLFPSVNPDGEAKYYVYYHSDPSKPNMRLKRYGETVEFNGRPFYVGKGCGNRYKSKKRGRDHLSIINSLSESGVSDEKIFHIFKDGLTELEALELEAKLITFFGCQSEISRSRAHFHGMNGGLLVNSDPAVRPKCVDAMVRVKGRINSL